MPAKTTKVTRPVERAPAAKTNGNPARPTNGLSRPGDVLKEAPRKSRPVSKAKPKAATEQRINVKRKVPNPSRPQFGSDSEGDSDDQLPRQPAKKSKVNGIAHQDRKRHVRDFKNWSEEQGPTFDLVHGMDLTTGSQAIDFRPAFDDQVDAPLVVHLQYPNATQQERFQIVSPKKSDGYNPHEDIVETVKRVLNFYLPEEERTVYLDDSNGIPFKLIRAYNRRKREDYQTTIDEFNEVITDARASRTMRDTLDATHKIPLPLVQRILDQVTVRTVSPKSEKLREYKSFSSNTYGELLPQFNSQIFRDTAMDSSSVFIDLGSGVGNVVLQAALEIGCESYGIEMMPNPCELARDQAQEFPARCRMWGLSTGSIELLDGDFLEDARLAPILQRADVVLINNELFSPELNESLRTRFLDLKEGARVVSLKSFVPPGWKLSERNSESICGVLEVEEKDFWSGCVSWTNGGGNYYVATKDSGRIERILSAQIRRGR